MEEAQGAPKNPNRLALERFLRDHSKMLVAYAHNHMGLKLLATTSAEDIVNETWLSAFQSIETFRSGDSDSASMKAWLYKILDHVVARTARKNLGTSRKKHKGMARLESDVLNARPADMPTLTRQASDDDAFELLLKSMKTLPQVWQTALELHYLQNLPVAEVAKRLDKTIPATHQLLARARARLRVMLGRSSLYFLPTRKLKPPPKGKADEQR